MTKTMAHRSHVFAVVALAATAICAATARAEVVSLDGTWQAEVAQDAQGDAMPARTRYVLIEIDDVSPNKLASIEEVEIH